MIILLLAFSLFQGGPAVVTLTGSNEIPLVSFCKIMGDYLYLADQKEVLLFRQDGSFVKKLVKPGGAPDRLDNVSNLFRQNDAIWVASQFRYLKISGDQVLEKYKSKGTLFGFVDGKIGVSSKKIMRQGVFEGYLFDPETEEEIPIYPTPEETLRNKLKIGNNLFALYPPYLCYGSGITSELYIQNLGSGLLKPLKVFMQPIRPYNPDVHGTIKNIDPVSFKKQARKIFSEVDPVLVSAGYSFWIEYRFQPYMVVTWAHQPSKGALYQIFDVEGKCLGFRFSKFPPRDFDSNGNLLFLIKDHPEDEDEDFKLVRIALDDFFDKVTQPAEE